jgi:serine/threonine protein kinase/predicted Zn-dependent protease
MNLRAEFGDSFRVEELRRRNADLSEETLVALIYEELCLREEAGEEPDLHEFVERFPDLATPLRRVFDIHGLIGSSSDGLLDAPPSSGPVTLPETGQTIAGFRLVEELGRGAFARVFLAEERQLADRPVALKVARNGSREPNTLARLQHTHIVPIYSYRSDPATGLHLLCMPYLGGVTLAELFADKQARCSRSGKDLLDALDRLEPSPGTRPGGASGRQALQGRSYVRAIAWWGARLAEALAHAHERGVLHRDVKPSNILVTSDGLPLLLDFNLAWESRLDDPNLEPAALGGTLAYMAPEHLEALADGVTGTVDPRADVYALGVVLYEAMGSRPFPSPASSGSLAAALLRAAEDRRTHVPSLSEEYPDIPIEFDAVVSRCLNPDPLKRYDNASDLAADLQAVADDSPLNTARVPLVWRVSGWMRRRRGTLAAGATLLLVVVMLSISALAVRFAQHDRLGVVKGLRTEGELLTKTGEFKLAMHKFKTASDLAEHWRYPELVEQHARAREAYWLADETLKARNLADEVFAQAEELRYALLGIHGRPADAFQETLRTLNIFYVLESPTDWTHRPEVRLLDDDRKERLIATVDDVLFLWTVAQFFPNGRVERLPGDTLADRREVLAICDRAIAVSPEPMPWKALKSWVEFPDRSPSHQDGADRPKRSSVRSSLACFHWASLRMLQNRPKDALAWLERGARLDANNYWIQYYLSYVHAHQQKDSLTALAHIEAAIALRPHSPSARFERAKLEFSRGNWSRSLDDLDTALRLSNIGESDGAPRHATAESRHRNLAVQLMRGNVHQAIGEIVSARFDFQSVLEGAGPDDPLFGVAAMNLARLDADAGGFREALRRYDHLVEVGIHEREARFGRGVVALRLGKTSQTEADLAILLKAAPNDPNLLALRALSALERGDREAARIAATAALRLRPNPAHRRLFARVALSGDSPEVLLVSDPAALGRLPGPETALRRDLERILDQPVSKTFDGQLQRVVILSAVGRRSEAEEAIERLVAERPASSAARSVLVQVLCHSQEWQRALSAVEAAKAQDSSDPRLGLLLGQIHTKLHNYREARLALNQAITREPGAEAFASRAELSMKTGRWEQALEDWNRAVKLDPDTPDFFLGRASCLRELGAVLDSAAELQLAADGAEGHAAIWDAILGEATRLVKKDPLRFPLCMIYLNRRLQSRLD